MKRIYVSVLFMLAVSSISAESMKFITVLSSPVGTFNRLEAVDNSTTAKGRVEVNFCTKLGDRGEVTIKGLKPAQIQKIALNSGTTLGREGEGRYSLMNVQLNGNGTLKGGRIYASTVQVDQSAAGKSDNLYGNTLTVAGAKTTGLNIGNGQSVMNGTHDAADMVWSNQYQNDEACKENGNYDKCKQQYLLKSKGGAVSGCSQAMAYACETDNWMDGLIGEWRESSCECICPVGFIVRADGSCGCEDSEYYFWNIGTDNKIFSRECNDKFLCQGENFKDFGNICINCTRFFNAHRDHITDTNITEAKLCSYTSLQGDYGDRDACDTLDCDRD